MIKCGVCGCRSVNGDAHNPSCEVRSERGNESTCLDCEHPDWYQLECPGCGHLVRVRPSEVAARVTVTCRATGYRSEWKLHE